MIPTLPDSASQAQTPESGQSTTSPGQQIWSERRARRFWVSLIVGLLGLQVLGGAAAIYLSVSDPTVAVIPNYYQAGLDWDVTKRNRDQFSMLGWTCNVHVQELDADQAQRIVVVELRDRRGHPVSNLRVTGQAYHHARGSEVHRLILDEGHPGDYLTTTRLTQAGLWQVELKMEGGHGTAEETLVVNVDSL